MTRRQRRRIQKQLQKAREVRYFRALQALLRLCVGTAVGTVAQEAGVTPQTTWVWHTTYRASGGDERVLRPVSPPGAPPLTGPSQNAQIESILQEDPQELGYQATGWTMPLLQVHLQAQHIELSQRTIRRRLKSLGYVWKRPSYVLAYPDPQWKARCRYIRRRVRRIREKHPDAVILFVDETDRFLRLTSRLLQQNNLLNGFFSREISESKGNRLIRI